ncbi:MAG: 16S rRNA processing protein RimM [Acidobacteria bacterium]|nr:MAG: 16S rRNA processing protein RimM [Acidobacteriota bacterium]
MHDDLLRVGRVARAHGNRGQVIVNPDTDFAQERFRPGQIVQVCTAGGSAPRRIASVRFHQGRPVIALEGVDTMDAAEALAGAELKMPAAALGSLPGGTFYHHDLVGCEVRDTRGEALGRVTGVEGPMERSRLVVQGPRGELLIPLVADICVKVDPAAREIVVDPPEGLLDLNE